MKIAVIILNYLTWRDTIKEAVLVHDLFQLDWNQIIIVDNNSPNESSEQLKKKEVGPYIFLQTDENKGYAYGNNVGLKYAYKHKFEYAWILNNDIMIDNDNVIKSMLDVFDKDKDIGVVNPDIYSPDGYLFNRDAKKRNFWDYTFGSYQYKKIGRKIEKKDGFAYVSRPQGCCMMVDLKKMFDIDYLDEHTFLYYEELILAARMEKKGYKCACAYNISVIHNHSKTVKQAVKLNELIKVQNQSFDYYLKEYRHYGWIKRKICILFKIVESYISG